MRAIGAVAPGVALRRLRSRVALEYAQKLIRDKNSRDSFGYAGAWSSRMKAHGFHDNHIHPQGWISSCYYVAVPQATEDQDTRQGWIKFGEPASQTGLKERRAIQPLPGRLVLFPSYMWHGTIPFAENSVRTTIAFDAVPR